MEIKYEKNQEKQIPYVDVAKIIVYYEEDKYLPFFVGRIFERNTPCNEPLFDGHRYFNYVANCRFTYFIGKEQLDEFFENYVKKSEWLKGKTLYKVPNLESIRSRETSIEELIKDAEYINLNETNIQFVVSQVVSNNTDGYENKFWNSTQNYVNTKICNKISEFPECPEKGSLKILLRKDIQL